MDLLCLFLHCCCAILNVCMRGVGGGYFYFLEVVVWFCANIVYMHMGLWLVVRWLRNILIKLWVCVRRYFTPLVWSHLAFKLHFIFFPAELKEKKMVPKLKWQISGGSNLMLRSTIFKRMFWAQSYFIFWRQLKPVFNLFFGDAKRSTT